MDLVIDLETVRDETVPFEPKTPDEFPPAACWRIVTIGAMALDGDRFGVVGGATEAERVAAFVRFIERERPRLITWNGRGFDIPVIVARALKYGIAMPWWYGDRATRYRYNTDGHWDVKDFLSDFGAGKIGHLDQAARLVGFPGKIGVDGSQVADMVAAGRQAEVDAYCLCDVAQTAAIALRVELMTGAMGPRVFGETARRLLDRIDAKPELAELGAQIDRAAFLLSPQVELVIAPRVGEAEQMEMVG